MKQKNVTFTQSPFGDLRERLKQKNIKLRKNESQPLLPASTTTENDSASERRLFLEAMSDVVPIKTRKHLRSSHHPPQLYPQKALEKDCTLKELENLIKSGKGFVIAQTDEYMEGINAKAHPEITRLLHNGHFTIQDHIDLHGLNVKDAKKQFDNFMKKSLSTRKKGLLIVHGRGLSSPVEPVLKKRVYQWLSTGIWRKWVVAFTSARACDGGAGATYVLLRDQPVKKYCRKIKRSMPY